MPMEKTDMGLNLFNQFIIFGPSRSVSPVSYSDSYFVSKHFLRNQTNIIGLESHSEYFLLLDPIWI